MIHPAGFHVIFLPFADDIRSIDHGDPQPVSENVLEAMKKIIDSLMLKNEGGRGIIKSNPVLDNLENNIKAMALEEDCFPLIDESLPDAAYISSVDKLLEEFVQITVASENLKHENESNEDIFVKKKGHKKIKCEDDEIYEIEVIKSRIFNGTMKKYTVAQLKTILSKTYSDKIEYSNKRKDDLIQLVMGVYKDKI